jgi:hypothetical protein
VLTHGCWTISASLSPDRHALGLGSAFGRPTTGDHPLLIITAQRAATHSTLLRTATSVGNHAVSSLHIGSAGRGVGRSFGPGAVTLSKSRTGRLCGTDRGLAGRHGRSARVPGRWLADPGQDRDPALPCVDRMRNDTVQLGQVELRSVIGEPGRPEAEQPPEVSRPNARLGRKTPGRSSLDEVPEPG